MADNGGGFNTKRFRGDGNDGAAAYKVWKRWAKAAIAVQKVKNTPAEAVGPWLYTLLDGQAALAVENVDISEINVESGEEVAFAKLDELFPDKVVAGRLGEATEEGSVCASRRARPGRPTPAGLGWRMPVWPRRESTCRRSRRAT